MTFCLVSHKWRQWWGPFLGARWQVMKKVFFIDLMTLKSLSIFFKKEIEWYFKEIDFKNMYANNIKNKEIVNLELEGFMVYL